MSERLLPGLCALFLLLLAVPAAPAAPAPHRVDQSYIYLRVYADAMEGRFEITTRDLNKALPLNLPTDRAVTPAEVEAVLDRIHAYYNDRVSIYAGGTRLPIRFTRFEILDLDLGDFLLMYFEFEDLAEVPDTLEIEYNVLFDVDPQHQGLFHIEHNWKTGTFNNESIPSLDFGPGDTRETLDLTDGSMWRGFMIMIRQGIWHIWIGIDHILFLLALLLPSVVRRKEGEWVPVENFRSALIYVVKVVTIFTLAHSVTLSLAALEVVRLPSRLVESIIAISILMVAVHNIVPALPGKDWMVVFGFGLFHGFGFASVLGELGAGSDYLVLTLLGFNLGVEIGQVAVICVAFPLLYLIRKPHTFYKKVLVYGSVLLILISLYWFIERAFEIDLPLGRIVNRIIGVFGLRI